MSDKPLIIIGASARAAAFSAYRAGYTPYWLDQFGDEDLRQRFRGEIITGYPKEAIALIGKAPDAPFIFTGRWKIIRASWRNYAGNGHYWAI